MSTEKKTYGKSPLLVEAEKWHPEAENYAIRILAEGFLKYLDVIRFLPKHQSRLGEIEQSMEFYRKWKKKIEDRTNIGWD